MPLDIVVGTQWGDEGKGRIVDLLSAQADYVARFNGGDNAGHTVTTGEQTFKLHLIPSGIIHSQTIAVIGNGVALNPETLLAELDTLRESGVQVNPKRLRISHAAHLITPAHRALDAAQEAARGQAAIGTTMRGIGPSYVDKSARRGLRAGALRDPKKISTAIHNLVGEINHQLMALYNAPPIDAGEVAERFQAFADTFGSYIADTSQLLSSALTKGKTVLAEGAQGTLLDLDHGTYPFVTSSTPTAPGALTGLGLGVGCVGRVIGVTKAFQTRVGSGPFPTELSGDLAMRLRGTGANPWDEYGTTTGRPRRVGWFDAVLLRYAVRINGITELALTKLDILSGLEKIKICVAYKKDGATFTDLPWGPSELDGYDPIYEELPGWEDDLQSARSWEDLPPQARDYILRIETLSGTPIHIASVGPEREQVVTIH